MKDNKNVLLAVLITIISMIVIFYAIIYAKIEWMTSLIFDNKGFPKYPHKNQIFIKNGRTYVYLCNGKLNCAWSEKFPENPTEGQTYTTDNGLVFVFTNGNWVTSGGAGGGPDSSERIQKGSGLPKSTIDEIDATLKQKGLGCVFHSLSYYLNGVLVNGSYYTYGGYEVTKEDCLTHGKL